MAYSTTYDRKLKGSDIITFALRKCGALAEGEAANSSQVSDYIGELNALLAALREDGLQMHTVKHTYLIPDREPTIDVSYTSLPVIQYDLPNYDYHYSDLEFFKVAADGTGPSGSENNSTSNTLLDRANVSDAEFVTSLPTTGNPSTYVMFASMQDSGYPNNIIQRDNVTRLSLPIGGTSTAIGHSSGVTTVEGNLVYIANTSNKVPYRPLDVLEAYCVTDPFTDDSVEMSKVSRSGFDNLSAKNSEGVSNQFYYDPQIDDGRLFIWPASEDTDYHIKLVLKAPAPDFVSGDEDLYMPQKWFLPVYMLLAEIIAPDCGVPLNLQYKISQLAEKYYMMVRDGDFEDGTSIQFTPNNSSVGNM